MAYGWEIRNGRGEVVLNDTHTPMRMVSQPTVTGTIVNLSTSIGTIQVRRFTVPKQNANSLIFARLPSAGQTIGSLDGVQFFNYPDNPSTLQFREVAFFTDVTQLDADWGIQVFNEDGQLIYTSAGMLIPISRTLSAKSGNNRQTPISEMQPSTPWESGEAWVGFNVLRRGWQCVNTQIMGGFQQGEFYTLGGAVSRPNASTILQSSIPTGTFGAPFVGQIGDFALTEQRLITGL